MLSPTQFHTAFARGHDYAAYLATATAGQRPAWDAFTAKVRLTEAQSILVRSFERRINVIVVSGTWCGDCVQQCPMLHRIAEAHPAPKNDPDAPGIDLRFLDRDEHPEIAKPLKICGGGRVPVAVFLNEEFDFISMLGDRTLARYRVLAAAKLGPSCPLPGAPIPDDEIAATTADWLNEFERVALLLRLSPKLRTKHED